MNQAMLDEFEAGAGKLSAAVAGLSREDLVAFPTPGTWSIQQIVMHVVDSDLVIADRMKRIIAEDNPALTAFDESKFAANLHYHEQSIRDALALFELNRRLMASVLRLLGPEAFARFGTHGERGRETLEYYVGAACRHLEHHLKFVFEKRKKLGKATEK